MSNLNGDLLDDGLRAVMGEERCKDVTKAPKEQKKTEGSAALIRQPQGAATFPKGEGFQDAKWGKAEAVSSMEKVKQCAKWAVLFGGISGLLFWWQQAGLLDPKAAVPSLIICALGAGLSIGWNAR